MHLEIDTIYPAPRGGSCHLRIYLSRTTIPLSL